MGEESLVPGDEVVLYRDHKRVTERSVRIVNMLVRAVVFAELDLQYNRPVEAHSKLSTAWQTFLDMTRDLPESFTVTASTSIPQSEPVPPVRSDAPARASNEGPRGLAHPNTETS